MPFFLYASSMSFNLRAFKDLKKDHKNQNPRRHYRHLILGHDLKAVLQLIELKEKYPEDSIRLISSRLITKNTLIESYENGVSTLRDEETVSAIYKKYYDFKCHRQINEPLFYKDGKFHEFSGRAKPMELRDGEDTFKGLGYRYQISSLFKAENWEKLDEYLSQAQDVKVIDLIQKTNPQDLVEKDEWLLTTKDYNEVTAENLYVTMAPGKFLNLIHDKSSLSTELMDYLSSVNVLQGIQVCWELNKELYNEERTIFIPQSMTHEWGHFIVEFEAFNHATQTQKMHVMFLIHEEEPQAEDLASKIRLMKRVVDRVFSDFEKSIKKEFILYSEEMIQWGQKDNLSEQISFDYPTLKLLGEGGPSSAQYMHLGRSLLGTN